ncbi:class I SAM-dependent methyltransferase [Burkholderia multivorans]|uniref:class I SAM-dependent methyltransferase n=1 Tax=Burkholderia multivorans TaxID=87883 RepID=UPI0013DF1F1B|nr:class I SAM-dependent methyltransferase [Burkholderia multivorans]MBU9619655.1 class I SAM-dependent methyltransferase [Burkholderia multivorans]NGM78205.1 class I SAM-dependent methyltransferase [Burkholderia multivorans]
MKQNLHEILIRHYETCLQRHGDTHLGVDWPNAEDANTRYRVMLDLVRPGSTPATLLDFGCGASHLYQYMIDRDVNGLSYTGLDASEAFCDLSQRKYPGNEYVCVDVLAEPDRLGEYDYIVMNGVFTEKRELGYDEMFDYFARMLRVVFPKARKGIAFNVMSKEVDWERDDLFHVPVTQLTHFVARELSRHYVVRHDYGLYEYTTYVYRERS